MGCCDATNTALDGLVRRHGDGAAGPAPALDRRTALKGMAVAAGGLTLAA